MPVVPFVPLIAAGVGAAGAVASANAANRGQQQAAQVSQQAADTATAEQRRQYDLTRADNAPWLQTGQSALGVLANMYGLNQQPISQPATQGSAAIGQYGFGGGMAQGGYIGNKNGDLYDQPQAATADMLAPQVNGGGGDGYAPPVATTAPAAGNFANFFASPDYQFRLNEGARALTARNAALGIQDSGAAQKSAINYAGNLASGEFNNYANRLAALAGVGQTAAAANQNAGSNYANAFTNITQNNAQNLSSSYQNRADTRANLYGGLAGSLTSGLQWLGNRYG